MNLRTNALLVGSVIMPCMVNAPRAIAQSAPDKQPQKEAEKQPAQQPEKKQDEPSLDELLGLDKGKAKTDDKDKPAADPNNAKSTQDAALERALRPTEDRDDFKATVDLMKETSDRLVAQSDPGLDTQRLQEQVLRKLDKLIDDAQKNQGKSSKQKPKDQNDQDQNPNQQQQQSSQSKPTPQPGTQAQGGDVPQQQAQPNSVAAGASAAWGGLPPHVRDALMQGLSDRFSTSYQRLTEEYYKRLASQERVQGSQPEKK